MSHYNIGSIGNLATKPNNNEIGSFEKSVMTNAKESIEKHLSLMKIDQNQLNYALFLSIENFKLDQHADQCILLLLRHKANPNCQFNLQTPLTLACRKGQQLIVKTLLQFGAKPDLCNKKGEQPLAVILKDRRQNYDVAQTLFNYNASANLEIEGKHALVIAVEREFLKIFQMMIQKGASLVYDTQNILHIVAKKKFKRVQKKRKFIKQLSGRVHLMQEDTFNKTPIEYQQNQQIKTYILQNFKQKILKQDSSKSEINSKSLRQKQQKQLKNKQIDQNSKQNKKKLTNKQFDVSFSQIDEEEDQEQKGDIIQEQSKLQQIVEIPQQQQKSNPKNIQLSSQKDSSINSPLINQKKFLDMSSSKEFDISINGLKQNKKQKGLQQSILIQSPEFLEKQKQKQQEKQRIRKKLNNSSILLDSKKKGVHSINQQTNAGKKSKKSKNIQQIVPKTLLKRKNSSFEDQSIKYQKNKATTVKKGNKKQVTQTNEKDKINLQQQKATQQKRILIFKEFQQLGLHLEQQTHQKMEKSQKQSQTDSQQSFRGSLQSLNEQIYELVNRITTKNQQKRVLIQTILNLLQNALRKQLQKQKENARIQLYVYGSQSTGLAIDNSDIDLLVISDFECNYLMKLLQERSSLDFDGVLSTKFIASASMPVIKLQLNQKFDGMNIDLTFQTRNHMGLKCSETIKAFMQAEPLLRPLVLVIKVLVNLYGLSDPYKGGLGSYAITLMVIALLQFTQVQKKKLENVGELLLNFLYFYGEEIDYISQAIIIHALGLFGEQPVYCIYRLPYFTDLNPKLIIYDPLNPVNNVGRTTYRIAALKKLFSVCYLRLKQDARCQLKDILDGSFSELLTEF